MSEIAIRAEGLGKQYRLGRRQERYRTLRDTLASSLLAPVRAVRRFVGGARSYDSREESFWALKDLSFEVKQGEIIGIVGRNGAGKSTLLKILSRITEPTEGFAEIHGRIGSLLEVGTGFHSELSGRENIYLNGAILGMRRAEIERKFDEIVEFSEVERFIDTPVKHYSSGMYLRLAFAVAAHLDPEILLVDEVLAVGDARFQRKCLGKMGEVARDGRTVLFVSHNMGAISNLCRSALCLENGRIVEQGDAERVITSYVSRMSAEVAGQGVADLRHARRAEALKDRRAQFERVRALSMDEEQRATFLEREPIVVEVRISVKEPVRDLQFGCVVFRLTPYVELFTVPSREYAGDLSPGIYSARLHIDPNYLREGSYTLGLKMFASGTRQDTLAEALRFDIVRYVSGEDDSVYFAGWVAGTLWFPYKWEEIEKDCERVR